MKVTVVNDKKRKRTLPEIGEIFKFINYNNVYLRIPDDKGEKALEVNQHDFKKFFAVCLQSGTIHYIKVQDQDSLEILQPVGGELKVEVV